MCLTTIDFIIKTKKLNWGRNVYFPCKGDDLAATVCLLRARGARALGSQRGCRGEGIGGCGPTPPPPPKCPAVPGSNLALTLNSGSVYFIVCLPKPHSLEKHIN